MKCFSLGDCCDKLTLFVHFCNNSSQELRKTAVLFEFLRNQDAVFFWRSLEILVLYVIAVIAAGKWRNKSWAKLSPSYFPSVVVKAESWTNVYLTCFRDHGLRVFPNSNTNIAPSRSTSPKVFTREGLVSGMGAKLRNDNTPGNLNWSIKSFHVPFLRVSEAVNHLCKCIIELSRDHTSTCTQIPWGQFAQVWFVYENSTEKVRISNRRHGRCTWSYFICLHLPSLFSYT